VAPTSLRAPQAPPVDTDWREVLWKRFVRVRQASIAMCEPLAQEDFRIQPCAEVSPPWWNLGHTSWFFARNVLEPLGGEYTEIDRKFDGILNSYYVSLGPRLDRDRRGLLTRPLTEEVYAYRRSVDARMQRLIDTVSASRRPELESLVTIGLQHEQQHQELFYCEIKAIGASNPLPFRSAYACTDAADESDEASPGAFIDVPGGVVSTGHAEATWCWDNELPVHQFYLRNFRLADRLVTNGEFLEFMHDSGYRNQLLWLDNGWKEATEAGWVAPLYWEQIDGQWQIWTLSGLRSLSESEPVCHVSFYEADAFARWKGETFAEFRGARLPTEHEWEHAARSADVSAEGANLLERGRLHPVPAGRGPGLRQMLGDVWEWTASYYGPYPGYRPFAGALSEYNGKFMDNQRVLRGGSCVTPSDHIRISYRNFFSGETRFVFAGLRLAQDA